MYEMLEIVPKLILLGGLTYFAWWDYRYKTVALLPIWLVGISGVFCHLFVRENSIWNMLASMSIGCLLVLISAMTTESIGMGDGLLFLVSGCYLSFAQNVALLIGTLFLLGGFATICLILKKKIIMY